MNAQQKIDIIRSILDHPQWEAVYLLELIEILPQVSEDTKTQKSKIKYEDIEVVKNTGDVTTHWTVEIKSKFTKRDAEKLADMIYNLGDNL